MRKCLRREVTAAGFSLIEVVLAIVCVSIMLVMAQLAVRGMDTARLNQAASVVVSDLRYAQQQAMATRRWYGLKIETSRKYAIHIDHGGMDTVLADPEDRNRRLVVDFDVDRDGDLRGVRFEVERPFCTALSSCQVCGRELEFNSLGGPTDSFGNPLCTGKIVLVKHGSGRQEISFEANTGSLSH